MNATVRNLQLVQMLNIAIDFMNDDFDHKKALHIVQACSTMLLNNAPLYASLKHAQLVVDALALFVTSMTALLLTDASTDADYDAMLASTYWQLENALQLVELTA